MFFKDWIDRSKDKKEWKMKRFYDIIDAVILPND